MVWIPAATRSDVTVFEPSEAAFLRKCFTIGILAKTNAYRNMQTNSNNVEIERKRTANPHKTEKIRKMSSYQSRLNKISPCNFTLDSLNCYYFAYKQEAISCDSNINFQNPE